MELQLTPEEKKSLERFFIYIRSFGADSASIDYYYEYGDQSWDSGLFADGKKINFFPEIEVIINKILEQVDEDDFEPEFHEQDNPDYFTIEIEFLAKEKSLRVSCEYKTMGSEEVTEENELINLAPFERYIEQGAGIIVCEYNGGGDSGYIESTMGVDGEPENVDASIEDVCYDSLTSFSGWEINEGSQGNIVFNLKDKTVTVNHSWNTEESHSFDLMVLKV